MQRTLSQYLLLEQVGSTGLATVYRAQDQNHDRVIAIKVLRPYVSTDPALLEKFSVEIDRVAKLSHPNILPIYRKENEEDIHWVSMEYSSWPTLRQWLQQPVTTTQAIIILKQLASATEAASLQGVHHGDIKPGNIFLDPETGHILLSDFGYSMLAEGAPLGARTAIRTPLPTYTAPERGVNSVPNMLSDVYSLGVLAFDMLTGTVPFNAMERASVQARQITSVPPTPSNINPNIPQQLDSIILKALAPHPERRYQTPSEFVEALESVSPIPAGEFGVFKITETIEKQTSFPGLEQQEALGPPLICTVCGYSNIAGATWCAECWGVLRRVAAVEGEAVISTGERTLRNQKAAKIRRVLLGSGLAAVCAITLLQLFNVTLPLTPPSSNISSESAIGEWSMIHRNFEGSGQVPGENVANIDGKVKWTFETSEPIVSVPIVKNQKLYLSTHDRRVIALDTTTGDIIWEHATLAPVDSSPSVSDDMIFVGIRNSGVISLDATTGKKIWEFSTKENPTTGSPIVKDGIVYIGSGDSHIYAVDALTGTKQWSYATEDWITNTPALSDDILAVSSLDGQVTIYDTDTGKRRFSFKGLTRLVMGSPIIIEDSIYAAYREGRVISVNKMEEEVPFAKALYRIKLQLWVWGMGGHPGYPKGLNWVRRMPHVIDTTMAGDQDKIYVPTQDGFVYAMDRLTGKPVWSFSSGINRLSTPTVTENLVLVVDGNGQLHALNRDTGEEEWMIQVAGNLTSTPVLAGGMLYLASEDGILYALE